MTRGNLEIVKLLLMFGARSGLVTDDDGYTALHYSEDGECAAYLIQWVEANSVKYPNISLPTFIDARDRYGNTPLLRIYQMKLQMWSNYTGNNNLENTDMKSRRHLSLMQLLIDKKADVNAVNLQGYTVLHFALMIYVAKKYDEVHIPAVISAVKILLDTGVNVNLMIRERLESSAEKPFLSLTPLLALFDSNYVGNINLISDNKNRRYYLREISEMLVNRGSTINIFDEQC